MTTTTTTEFRIIGNSIKAAVKDMHNNHVEGQQFIIRLSELIKNECQFRGVSTKAFKYLADIIDVEKTFGISEYAWSLIADTL